jgi:translation initiation factor IF-2
MALNQKNSTRISNLAKDLNLKNKDILDILAENGIEGKSHSAILDPEEFNIVMNELTSRNQITGIGDYLDGKVKLPSPAAEKPAAKNEKQKIDAPKTEATKAAVKPEVKSAVQKSDVQKPVQTKDEAHKSESARISPTTELNKTEQNKTETTKIEMQKTINNQPKNDRTPRADQNRPQQNRQDFNRPANQNRDGAQQNQQSDFRRDNNSSFNHNRQQGDTRQPQGDFRRDNTANNQNRQQGDIRPHNAQNSYQRPQQGGTGGQWQGSQNQGGQSARPSGNHVNKPHDKDKDFNQPRNTPKPAPVHTYTRNKNVQKLPGESRVVDTRTVTLDLDKYDERIEHIIPESSKDARGEKQKLKKQNTRDYQSQREKERLIMEKLRKQGIEKAKKQPMQITVPDEITVGELASRMKMTAGDVIKKLIKLGVMATVNQSIDYDTAFLVADELGVKVSREVVVTIEERLFDNSQDKDDELVARSPVVCVMGHVDHGKTSLLDAIRHTNVTAGEAGGITQAIGAYRVTVNGRDITFLDTPGHEAFTAMRARGAKSTDIAILVVAADDGIMPQTVEAINHAKAAGIDIVVAINKMDKPTANPDVIKQELTKYNLVPEEWGGDTICVPVSALTKQGLDDLLENLLLVADMKELKANPNRRAKGIVIEARLDKGRGPVATVLVQNGTLNSGDIVIAGTAVGRVRAMTDDKGRIIKSAGPSVPVEIIGLSEVPESGDDFAAVEDERMARELAEQRKTKVKEEQFKSSAKVNLNDLFSQISEGVKDLNIIIKADVGGSAEAVKQSLLKLSNEEVRINIIHTGVGGITEGDVMLAAASNALIVGFNVRPDKSALDSAGRQSVEIRTYRIIYECIEEIQAAMKGLLAPQFKEVLLGHAQVRQTINVPNVGTIAGSYVQDGKITRSSQIRVIRDGIVIFEDKISSLKRFKDDVREVAQGYECGIGLDRFNDIKEGDILEAFIMEEIKRD